MLIFCAVSKVQHAPLSKLKRILDFGNLVSCSISYKKELTNRKWVIIIGNIKKKPLRKSSRQLYESEESLRWWD